MKFRKLYWVTEQIGDDNQSSVLGVFTSIPDLIRIGLRPDGPASRGTLRLSLFQLDTEFGPLATWTAPEFDHLCENLQPFVKTDEFTAMECGKLVSALRDLSPLSKVP